MPTYLFTGNFTAQGAQGVQQEGGSARVRAVRDLFASVGGSLESYHFAFGKDDYFIIGKLPSNAAAAAVSLRVSSSGAVSNRTVVLLTPEEFDEVAKLSPAYRAPGS